METRFLSLESEYANAKSFSEGVALIYQENKKAILKNSLSGKEDSIGKIGKMEIKAGEDSVEAGLIWVEKEYVSIDNFSEGLAVATIKANNNYQYLSGYINKLGQEVIPLKYEYAGEFSEGLAAVYLDGKWGYIDKSGNEIIPLKYDDAHEFSEGLAVVGLNGKYGYIDKSGNKIIPFKYDLASEFS